MSEPAPIGHNNPPASSLPTLIPRDVILSLIAVDIAPLRTRADELIASCKRFLEAHPKIETDEADQKATEVLSVVQRFTAKPSGRVATARDAFKRPVQDAVTEIGSNEKGPYAAVIVSVESVAQAISRASINYKVAKENKARAEALAEAKKRADEAALAERMAARGSSTVSYADAANAAQAAEDAQKVAEAKPAELTRTHGDGFGTSSLRYKRVVTVTAPADVPRVYCVPDLAAITRAAGKAGTPIPVIAGCTITDEPDLTVRR